MPQYELKNLNPQGYALYELKVDGEDVCWLHRDGGLWRYLPVGHSTVDYEVALSGSMLESAESELGFEEGTMIETLERLANAL